MNKVLYINIRKKQEAQLFLGWADYTACIRRSAFNAEWKQFSRVKCYGDGAVLNATIKTNPNH